ncbi:MAG: c-type cytochrome, partial [Gemmataceae bacterium]
MQQPRNRVLASGLLVVAGSLLSSGCSADTPPAPPSPVAVRAKPLTGGELYLAHCAGCHGEKGDGNGLAARFLNPRPRDFSEAQFRLVSTKNNIPLDADLEMVVRQGMPGSAMMPFGHLPDAEIKALVGEVRRLLRSGQEQRLRKQLADSGEEVSNEDLAKTVDSIVRPGDPIPIPAGLPAATKESIARGKVLYLDTKLGCVSCHGETGKGDGVQEQKNSDGMPTRPRDFTRGIFKGGRDVKQMYLRVRRGMPGSPMPSADFLSDQQVGDLVNFILSLSRTEATERVSHARRELLGRRVERLPDEAFAGGWAAAKAVPVVVTPLWWRDQPDPELRVQALHDGKALAVRLTWRDEFANDRVTRPDDFEDMAAVQLYKGQPEPFLGMGGVNQGIDLWLWRASWQGRGREPSSLLDEYPFDEPLYRQLTKGKEKGLPDFNTARAAGNLNARPDGKASASALVAKGLGSTTLRPVASQRVTSKAGWKNGEWAVTLRRTLAVGAGEGVSLAAGEGCSIAFALWFGERHD